LLALITKVGVELGEYLLQVAIVDVLTLANLLEVLHILLCTLLLLLFYFLLRLCIHRFLGLSLPFDELLLFFGQWSRCFAEQVIELGLILVAVVVFVITVL